MLENEGELVWRRWKRLSEQAQKNPYGFADDCLTPRGRLKRRFQPAVYLDSSVLLDYWVTEGYDAPADPYLPKGSMEMAEELVQALSPRPRRTATMEQVRESVVFGPNRLGLVASPLGLIEMQGRLAELGMYYWMHRAVGASEVMRRGREQAGELLRGVWDTLSDTDQDRKEAARLLLADTHISPSFLYTHGLEGVLTANIRNLDCTCDRFWRSAVWLMSYVQIGGADVMHVLFAHHLGCQYFASFDSDFKRAEGELEKEFRLKLISSPQQLLDEMRRK